METLNDRQKQQIANSYFGLLNIMLKQPSLPTNHVRCLIRWALQLGLKPNDVLSAARTRSHEAVPLPVEKRDKMRAVFHLVYMTCLDQIVEETELEVAQFYANKIGLDEGIVAAFFQSITTADYDELDAEEMEEQIIAMLEAID